MLMFILLVLLFVSPFFIWHMSYAIFVCFFIPSSDPRFIKFKQKVEEGERKRLSKHY